MASDEAPSDSTVTKGRPRLNLPSGLFRLWVVCSALFVLGVAVTSYHGVREEFRQASLPRDYYDKLAEKSGGTSLLPVDCGNSRGTPPDTLPADFNGWDKTPVGSTPRDVGPRTKYATPDFSVFEHYCWYEMQKFRTLYPEYKDLQDYDLNVRLYAAAGQPLKQFRPWTMVMEQASVAFGIPLAVLVLGWALVWAFRGFAVSSK